MTLTKDEFSKLFLNSGLKDCQQSEYGVDIELEAQLKASFPKPGDDEVIRKFITENVGSNSIGVNARLFLGFIKSDIFFCQLAEHLP